MFVDKQYGLVSSKGELNMLRKLNKEVIFKLPPSYSGLVKIDEAVICGSTQQVQVRCDHDYYTYKGRYDRLMWCRKPAQIVINDGALEKTIYYISVNSDQLDGYNFKNISVDASAVKPKYRDKLFRVLDILMNSQTCTD